MRSRRLFDGAQVELGILPIVEATGGSVTINAVGIPSAEAFGNPVVTSTGGGTASVFSSSILSAEAFGTASLTVTRVVQISAFGIISQEAFGNAVVSTGGAVVSVRRYYPRHMRKFIGRR